MQSFLAIVNKCTLELIVFLLFFLRGYSQPHTKSCAHCGHNSPKFITTNHYVFNSRIDKLRKEQQTLTRTISIATTIVFHEGVS